MLGAVSFTQNQIVSIPDCTDTLQIHDINVWIILESKLINPDLNQIQICCFVNDQTSSCKSGAKASFTRLKSYLLPTSKKLHWCIEKVFQLRGNSSHMNIIPPSLWKSHGARGGNTKTWTKDVGNLESNSAWTTLCHMLLMNKNKPTH